MKSSLHSPGMAPLRQISLLLTALAVTIVVAGCGGGDDSRDLTGEPFTAQNELDFNAKLDKIEGLVAEGECDEAQQNLDTLTVAVEGVPSDVDQQLKDDLIELLGRLGDQVQGECQQAETTTTEDTTEEPDTTTVEPTTTTTTTTTTDETTDTTQEPTPPETPEPPSNPGQGGNPGSGGTPGGGQGGQGGGGTDPGSGGITPRAAR